MFTETEIGNIAPSNSDIYTVVSGLVHDGTDYRALIDIDDAREITVFEHILQKFRHHGLDSWKWNKKAISMMRGKSPHS